MGKLYDLAIELNEQERKKNEEENIDRQLSKFIFDNDEVIKEENFVYCRINGEIGYGFYFEKMCDKYDKKGNYLGEEQRRVPIIITNKRRIIEIGNNLNINEKIRIRELPAEQNYPLRWDRDNIKKYLKGSNQLTQEEIKHFYEKLKEYYKQYIYFDNENWYDVHALWDIGTYFFMLFDYYPLIELRGSKGTGKTKVMSTSRLFTFNATEEMTNPSEATLFRETHDKRPTKYIDEAEKLYFFNPKTNHIEADPRAELINSGFKYSGSVPRQEKIGSKFVTVYYKTYSPTMVGSINGLYGATEDRAIVHIMTKPKEMVKKFSSEPKFDENVENLRNFFYTFGLQYYSIVEKNYFNEANVGNVEKSARNSKEKLNYRDYNIWKPLLSIAEVIDSNLYNSLYDFAIKQTEIKLNTGINEGTNDYKTISTFLLLHIEYGKQSIYIKDIIDHWPKGEAPNPKTIGNYLDKAGFRDEKKRDSDGTYYEVNVDKLNNIIYSTYSTLSTFLEEKKNEDKNVECKIPTFASLNLDILKNYLSNIFDFSTSLLELELKEKYEFSSDQLEQYIDKLCTEGLIAKVGNDKYRRL